MKIRYFADTDTALIEFSERVNCGNKGNIGKPLY